MTARPRKVVLIVEDEPLLRMMAVDLVQEAGFEAIEATSADEAVAILENRTDVRIVFTDIDMPGSVAGIKLAAAIRDRWPPIEILIISGNHNEGDLVLPERSTFFAKPYDLDAVTAELHRMAA